MDGEGVDEEIKKGPPQKEGIFRQTFNKSSQALWSVLPVDHLDFSCQNFPMAETFIVVFCILRSFNNGSCYEHHSFYLTNGKFYPLVTSPNHLCDSILGPSESPLPTRRSQGASILELNSFAFHWPCYLFQIWILHLAQQFG